MNVLYIDGVGPFGGASRSLFETVRALKKEGVTAFFIAVNGTALEYYEQVGNGVVVSRGLSRFDNTDYSYYRGIRWLVLLREFFHFPFTILAIRRAHRQWRENIDVIHVNEVTEIIPGLIAKFLFKAPMVVHVRSAQWANKKSIRSRLLNAVLHKSANAIIAIDETVRSTLPAELTVDVIHNSFTPIKLQSTDPLISDKLLKLSSSSLKVGFVGNIQVSKGILDLVEAARLLKEAGADVEFLIVGGHTRIEKSFKGYALKMTGLAQDVLDEVKRSIEKYNLGNKFHLIGAIGDIQSIYERLDIITFPSHFNAPGRPIFEAAFSGVPSIVAIRSPLDDTLIHNETGLAIPAKDPVALSDAIRYFEINRAEVKRMGVQAKKLASANFDPTLNAARLHNVYKRIRNIKRCM